MQRAIEFGGDGTGFATTRPRRSVPSAGGTTQLRPRRPIDPPVQRIAGVGQIEAGEGVGPVAEDPDIQRFEPFQGGRNVEDRLDAGAHHHDGRAGQRGQVRRLVPGIAGQPVHATQAAGREHPDAGPGGQMCGGGYGGRAVAAESGDRGDFTDAHLGHLVDACDHPQRLVVQPDPRHPAHECDGGRKRSAVADSLLDLPRDPVVIRSGQAVADDGALQRHHRLAGGQRLGYLRVHLHARFLHPVVMCSCRRVWITSPSFPTTSRPVGQYMNRCWRRSACRPRRNILIRRPTRTTPARLPRLVSGRRRVARCSGWWPAPDPPPAPTGAQRCRSGSGAGRASGGRRGRRSGGAAAAGLGGRSAAVLRCPVRRSGRQPDRGALPAGRGPAGRRIGLQAPQPAAGSRSSKCSTCGGWVKYGPMPPRHTANRSAARNASCNATDSHSTSRT